MKKQLTRLSNGWGRIAYIGGLVDPDADTEGFDPADAVYRARVYSK